MNKVINLEELHSSRTNPRKHFDEAELAELAASIKKDGIVLVPLIVRPSMEDNKKHEIVDGERRYRAAKMAGLKAVPCDVRDLTDEEAVEIQIVANLQRADIEPLDEARGFALLMATRKCDQQALADRVGKPIGYVAKRVRLLKLVPELQKALEEERIGLAHALMLAKLTEQQQRQIAKDDLFEGWGTNKHLVTAKHLAELIRASFFLSLTSAPFDTKDATLIPKAGACTTCAFRTGANPGLFDDVVSKGEHCTKHECFSTKISAHIDRTVMQYEAEGKTLYRISERYEGKAKGVLTTAKYDTSKKPLNANGIYVDGDLVGTIAAIHIEGKKNSDPGEKAERGHLSPAEMKKRHARRLEIWGNKIEKEVRLRIAQAVVDKVTYPIDRKDLELIVTRLGTGMWKSWQIDRLCQLTKIQKPKNTEYFHELEEHLAKIAPRLKGQQLVGLAIALCLDPELIEDPSYISEDADRLDALAKRYAVNRGTTAEQVRKEWEPKKPKASAAKKPEPKATKKPAAKNVKKAAKAKK